MNDSETYMREAVAEASEGIHAGHGGPFGCVIVKDGKIVGRGHNRVLINHDPTMHGEMAAIREAGTNLGTHDLSGCDLYTTGEPCPMCLCACLWANIKQVYYGCTIEENADIGFRDERFDRLMGGRENLRADEATGETKETPGASQDDFRGYLVQTEHEMCRDLFEEYAQMQHTIY